MAIDLAELDTTIEEVIDTIDSIADGIEKLNSSKLKRRTVVILLRNAIGSRFITKKQINLVLDRLPDLRELFLEEETS